MLTAEWSCMKVLVVLRLSNEACVVASQQALSLKSVHCASQLARRFLISWRFSSRSCLFSCWSLVRSTVPAEPPTPTEPLPPPPPPPTGTVFAALLMTWSLSSGPRAVSCGSASGSGTRDDKGATVDGDGARAVLGALPGSVPPARCG